MAENYYKLLRNNADPRARATCWEISFLLSADEEFSNLIVPSASGAIDDLGVPWRFRIELSSGSSTRKVDSPIKRSD